MNISYNWLRELTGATLEPRALADLLTRIGLAVEVVHQTSDDSVFEIDLTSNRPDCLSHLGVAREVAAAGAGKVSLPEATMPTVEGRAESYTTVEIRDPDLCARYAGRVVRGVTIKPSPDWLVKRLESIGQRPINNVTDVTNYVLHEQGQPLHAFDLAKLTENRIVVRRARSGEKIKTLDGTERELDAEMLVIADAVRPVAVAGVMGGEDTEISAQTRDVLIESAYFDPASVRRTSRLLGLRTEASHRFERGVDYAGVLRARERCVAMICELAGGSATENGIDVYPRQIEAPEASIRPERIKALTGLGVDSSEVLRILLALGFTRHRDSEDTEGERGRSGGARLTFIAPTWRVDIEREEDLVEEVARHTGYEKIATELPASNIAGEYQTSERKRRALRRVLMAFGFDEAISFSFIDTAHDDRFEFLPNFVKESGGQDRFVTLTNPIIEGVTRMRPTLLAGMLEAVRHNFNHGTRDVRLFETGRVFAADPDPGKLPPEREAFAMVVTGMATVAGRAGGPREVDFYDVKGALEAVTAEMNLPPLRFEAAQIEHLREGQSARVMLSDERLIGSLGRLDDAISAHYKFRQPLFLAEVDLSALLEMEEIPVFYAPLTRYPSVVRDVSLLVERRVTLAEMLDTIRGQKVESCRDTKLVDVYEGGNLPAGKRSITLRMEYRENERTLRDEEVDEMHATLVVALVEKLGAERR